MPVDPHVIDMLHKVLWPAPAMYALWTHATTLAMGNIRWLIDSPVSPAESRSPHDARMGQVPSEQRAQVPLPMKRQIPGGPTTTPPSADRPKDGGTLTPPVDSGKYEAQAGAGGDAKPGVSGAGRAQATAIDDSGAHPELMRDLYPQAWSRLVHSLHTLWRRKTRLPPPGCVCLNGRVNVRTTKCIVLMDVTAWFDPQAGKFDTRSLSISLRATSPLPPKAKG